jgi:glucuronokinase
VKSCGELDLSSTFVASNATYYKYFEFWSLGHGIPLSNIVNSGRTLADARVDIHTLRQVAKVAKKNQVNFSKGVLIVAADSLFSGDKHQFTSDLQTLISSSTSAVFFSEYSSRSTSGPTVLGSLDRSSMTISSITGANQTGSSDSTVSLPLCFFLSENDANSLLFDQSVLESIQKSNPISNAPSALSGVDSPLSVDALLSWVCSNSSLKGVPLRAPFILGACDGSLHATPSRLHHDPPNTIHTRAYARVGLLGNPSDGFCGKTMSVTISNFFAEAWLVPNHDASTAVKLVPHELYDPLQFHSLEHLAITAAREGYSGGIRLMTAALHRFFKHLHSRNVSQDVLSKPGFSLRYHTSVPRQVGLAGSSAIVTALLRALMAYYGFGDEASAASIGLSNDLLPNFVLAIESEELGITAGLQDRVVQAYEGLVHMDFSRELMQAKGHGNYTLLSARVLPPLFLAYAADPSDSGRIHAPVKQRWLAGEQVVIDAMNDIASNADEALRFARETPYCSAAPGPEAEAVASAWAKLFTRNFEGRRGLFGDAALGKDNLRMISIAREVGAAGKFPGSGGAIVGVVDVAGIEQAGKFASMNVPAPVSSSTTDAAEAERVANLRVAAASDVLRAAYHAEGYVYVRLLPQERELI